MARENDSEGKMKVVRVESALGVRLVEALVRIVERYETMEKLVAAVSDWEVGPGDVFEMNITGTVPDGGVCMGDRQIHA